MNQEQLTPEQMEPQAAAPEQVVEPTYSDETYAQQLEPQTHEQTKTLAEMQAEFDALPEDQKSLLVFRKNLNQFAQMLANTDLSRKSIKNLFIHAALSPMSKEEPTWSYPEQKELFTLFEELQGAKFMLMYAGIKAQEKKENVNESRTSSEVSDGVVENAPSPVGNTSL